MLFGETAEGLALMAIVCAAMALSWAHWRQEPLRHDKEWWLFWGSYIGIASLGILTSESWLQTLNKVVIIACSFLFTSTWWLIDRNWIDQKLLAVGVLLLGCVLSVMTGLLFIFPEFSQLLPAMNVLVATYGHNHANIFFLFCVPIAWRFWRQQRDWWWAWGPLFLMVGGIVLSFGRVAVFLAACQLLWLAHQEFGRRQWPGIAKVAIATVSTAVVILGVLSLWPGTRSIEDCPLPVLKAQLCKALVQEGRPAYWRQTIQGIAERPIFGWGANTFPIVSKKLQHNWSEYSAYPHNEYLQWIVEFGLLGGGWLLYCFGRLMWLTLRAIQKMDGKHVWLQAMGVGVASMWVDAVFNYNWSYLSVWILMMLAMGLIIRESEEGVQTSQRRFTRRQVWLLRGWLGALLLGVVAWGSIFGVSTWWWRQKSYDRAVLIYPFVYWRVEDSLTGKFPIKAETRAQLLRWYWGNEQMVRSATLGSRDPSELAHLYERLTELQPQQLFPYVRLWRLDLQAQQPKKVWQRIVDIQAIVSSEEWWRIEELDSRIVSDTAQLLSTLATIDPHSTSQVAGEILRHQPWHITHASPPILLFQEPYSYPPETISALVAQWPSESFWPYEASMEKWWADQLRENFDKKNWEKAHQNLEQYVRYLPWKKREIWKIIENEMSRKVARAAHDEEKTAVLLEWAQFRRVIDARTMRSFQEVEWEARARLQSALLLHANTMISTSPEEAEVLYQRAVELDVSPLTSENAIFLHTKTSSTVLAAFIDVLVEHDAWYLFSSRKADVQFLQRAATLALENGKEAEAEWLLTRMMQLWPTDYWVSSQLGNFWYQKAVQLEKSDRPQSQLWYQKAKQEYQKCLATFASSDETDCFWGLSSLELGMREGTQRYQRAAEAILR
jgi:O-antigen ligase